MVPSTSTRFAGNQKVRTLIRLAKPELGKAVCNTATSNSEMSTFATEMVRSPGTLWLLDFNLSFHLLEQFDLVTSNSRFEMIVAQLSKLYLYY